jgi:hypothetical protein
MAAALTALYADARHSGGIVGCGGCMGVNGLLAVNAVFIP